MRVRVCARDVPSHSHRLTAVILATGVGVQLLANSLKRVGCLIFSDDMASNPSVFFALHDSRAETLRSCIRLSTPLSPTHLCSPQVGSSNRLSKLNYKIRPTPSVRWTLTKGVVPQLTTRHIQGGTSQHLSLTHPSVARSLSHTLLCPGST